MRNTLFLLLVIELLRSVCLFNDVFVAQRCIRLMVRILIKLIFKKYSCIAKREMRSYISNS